MIFEVYLLQPEQREVSAESILEILASDPRYRATSRDPFQRLYSHPDTGTKFEVLVLPPPPDEQAPLGENDTEEHDEALDEDDAASEVSDAESEAAGDELPGDEAGLGASESAPDEPTNAAPVTLRLPLACPSFFGEEALAVAQELAAKLGLELAGDVPSAADLLPAWQAANRKAADELLQKGFALKVWTPERASSWHRYGLGRESLAQNLAPHGVDVPVLQAALHENEIKTLVTWQEGASTLLPRCDLVLVDRERVKKSLLFSRRTRESGLIKGEKLWEILAPHSERIDIPVEALIFHASSPLPQSVAAALEVLLLEPAENARRRELLGVVDFEPERNAAGAAAERPGAP